MKAIVLCVLAVIIFSCKKSGDEAGVTAAKKPDDVVLTLKSLNVPISTFDIGNYSFQSVMVGNDIYYASYSNTAKTQFLVRYNVNSNSFSSALAKSANVCACGYMNRLLSDGTNVYYIANDATKYVASSNTWQTLTYPSTAKDNAGEAGSVYYNGNLYFVGGRTASTMFKYYNISQDKWFTVPNYLYPTSRSELAVYKDRIYVLGGDGAKRKFAWFSVGSNSWTALPDTPFDVSASYEGVYSAVLNNYLFLLQSKNVYVYDLVNDVWAAAPITLSEAPAYANLFSNGQKLYLSGKNSANIPVAYELTMSFKP
ncbi:hypothetical protein [Arsenicibacter rosenii]|uniref:Galactose oxidase n=1 Tax=Arsenicibacter rosenii TaxID=1750698 RepID=A0A1S2VBB3_9BACT|nr:hypothetical protein [Arsenicibacter rosenii]OIN55982.1 hypothetical protein BLX24_26905 [Arsenicibacter rosenii]